MKHCMFSSRLLRVGTDSEVCRFRLHLVKLVKTLWQMQFWPSFLLFLTLKAHADIQYVICSNWTYNLFLSTFYAFATWAVSAKALCLPAVCLSVCSSIRSFLCLFSFLWLSGQILLQRYLMNGLSNLNETYREYSLAPTDNLIRFWKSEIKGQGHSRLSSWQRHSRRGWGVKLYLMVNTVNTG